MAHRFQPEDYPGGQPDEWYETYVGKIVGHVSIFRELLNPVDPEEIELVKAHNAIPRVCFSFGSWEDGLWVNGVTGGMGVVLQLDESGEVPTVLFGDFKEYEQSIEDPDDSIDVEAELTREISLDKIGHIIGGCVPPEYWREDEA